MRRCIAALALAGLLCSCASSADLRTIVEERVPDAVRQAVETQRLSATTVSPPTLRASGLEGWTVESFQIEPRPPFTNGYRGGREYLIEVASKQTLHTDRYVALSTKWMESHCQGWALAVGRAYEAELRDNGLQLAPVRCNRLVSPDHVQVYDVITFSAARGSFVDAAVPLNTAQRLAERFSENLSVYGPWIRSVELEARRADLINGVALAQVSVRRYTYWTTFMHAEFGKSRVYDSYWLLLVSPQTLTLVQTFFPPDLKEEELWRKLASVIGALHQPR